ncbi:MAG: thiol:disulfide interchange protein DsbA/DsbL, partial [Serpentinimonas sp.]|nr:thiol:disulfide interchange protein DsbA/DsbL [Serpentinimonas sp.]
RHVPVGFAPEFEPLQRLFYTLEAMGHLDSHHERVFHAIHRAPRQRLHDAEAIAQWAASAGLDRARFTQTYNSFAVVGRVRRATQLQDAYQVEGTPALGIAGRFYIPGQAERTLQVANMLIERVRRG